MDTSFVETREMPRRRSYHRRSMPSIFIACTPAMGPEAPWRRRSRLDFRHANVYQNRKGGSGDANTFPALGHPPVFMQYKFQAPVWSTSLDRG